MNWRDPDQEDTTIYKVVINHEEQYSIWPEYKENPLGWFDVGKSGPKAECLAYIKEVWTDMRPLSLRKKMEELANNPPPPPPPAEIDPIDEVSLVDRLCDGDHPVEVVLRPRKSIDLFKQALARDYVHIKFNDTRGGTELGVRLDRDASDIGDGKFDNGHKSIHLEGGLTLDYVNVKCIADLNLETFEGTGRLTKVLAEA